MNAIDCRGCGAQLPDPFLDLGSTPLANSYLKPEGANDPEPAFPLAVSYCPACHLVQLTHTIPPKEMFSEYLYFSSFSESFVAHAKKFADGLVARFSLGPDSRVVEIASNDGYLLQFLQQQNVSVLGIEPAANIAAVAREKGIPTLNRFFGSELAPEILGSFGSADVIIGNNVFAHVPTTNDFLSGIYACLRTGGCAVLEFPYMRDLLEHGEFDTIYHEHFFYFTLSAVKVLAERAGLQLIDVQPQKVHGGSLRVFLYKGEPTQSSVAVRNLLLEEEATGLTSSERYNSFSRSVNAIRTELVTLLRDLKASGKSIAAYGAPAKGNTLLNFCQLGKETIEFTVDRSPYKQGLLLPGSRIPILAPEELLRRKPDYTLILPWNIAEEIQQQQAQYVHEGGRFIVPVPTPAILQTSEGLPHLDHVRQANAGTAAR